MTNTVPALSFVAMGISILFAIAIPVGLLLFYRKKYNCQIKPFFIGCGVFIIFALVLEGALHTIILGGGRAQARPAHCGDGETLPFRKIRIRPVEPRDVHATRHRDYATAYAKKGRKQRSHPDKTSNGKPSSRMRPHHANF